MQFPKEECFERVKDKKEKRGFHEPASRARLRPGALRAALRGWLARDAGGTSEKL
ncbi:hypothetical protein GCM10007870_29990 [Gluconobacter kondonii]|uniref:Uncharacterized protein n=1 Tax=Gluconobacter kondonii TaxID=941463 RepID=A0ABQ5WVG5_9PROT|nr:hypothetical protein GCM10007870_29990 [Gluconobacter kondonii]